MKPAERYAALKALRREIDAELEELEPAVWQALTGAGADRLATPLGKITLAGADSKKIIFDEARLLEFAEASDLDGVEIIKKVRPTFRNLFSILGDADGWVVIFEPTGELVDWAKVIPGTSYLSTRLSDRAKQRAAELLAGDNVAQLMIGGDLTWRPT